MFGTLVTALAPICFCIFVGWLAGRLKIFDSDRIRPVSTYVVTFALPALLFVGTFKFTIAELEQWQNLVAMLIAMSTTWFAAFYFGRFALGLSEPEAAILGLTSSFPNMAYIGIAVLLSLFSTVGLLPAILGNFVSSFVLIPLTIVFLHRHGPEHGAGASTLSKDLRHAVTQPLIWAPLLAIVFVLFAVKLPVLANGSISMIGGTAGGVALFAVGVMLFSFSFRIDRQVATVFVLKNLVQPALAAAFVFAFGLKGAMAEGIIIVLACPAATACPMLASTYRIGEKSAAAAVAVSTVTSLLTLSGWILLSESLFAR